MDLLIDFRKSAAHCVNTRQLLKEHRLPGIDNSTTLYVSIFLIPNILFNLQSYVTNQDFHLCDIIFVCSSMQSDVPLMPIWVETLEARWE